MSILHYLNVASSNLIYFSTAALGFGNSRDLEMKSLQLMKAEGKIQILEKQCDEKNEQVSSFLQFSFGL